MQTKSVPCVRVYLEPQDILHSGRLSVAHARVKEAGGDGDAQRFARHSSVGATRVAGNDPERAEQEHQQLLRMQRQRGY